MRFSYVSKNSEGNKVKVTRNLRVDRILKVAGALALAAFVGDAITALPTTEQFEAAHQAILAEKAANMAKF